MKLAFNAINGNLGNNGGSRSIILCSKTLEKLGYECNIVATVDNFTWFDHKQVINYIPNNIDAVINVAAVDYDITKKLNIPIKVAWWRAHENWNNSEEYLKQCYIDKEVVNIVNSNGLKQLLSTYGADSKVIYPGIDFFWEDRNLRPKDKIRIGCLYQKKPTKRWKDFVTLAKILGHKDYEYVGFGDTMRNDGFLTDFKCNPPINELINFYSSCRIFFAPTELEGLFNPAQEAALCGCLIVCGDEPMNGMIYDYAFPDNTAMVYERKNIEHAAELIKNPNWNLIENMQKHLKNNIGTREENMKKFIKCLEGM